MKAGALTESARREELVTKRGPVIERPVIDTVLDAPVPWLLTLIPVGSLVVAGLLTAMLAWFATPTVTTERTEHRGGSRPRSADHGRSGMRRVDLASWTDVHALGRLASGQAPGAGLAAGPQLLSAVRNPLGIEQ